MADLLLRDLVTAAGGRLSFAAMPPRDGDLLMLRRSTASVSDVQPGDLYWALRAPADDGMQHVEEAFARGAAGAVISGRNIEPWPGKFTLAVESVTKALWQAAALARTRFAGTVIAVAGDEHLADTSAAIHRVLGTELSGSLAEQTPAGPCMAADLAALGLLNAHPSHDYVVLPLAGGNLAAVAQRCCPHACVITSAHDADRAELLIRTLDALPESGWAIVNGDDAELRRAAASSMSSALRTIWVGRDEQNDLVAGSDDLIALPAIALGKILNISDLSATAALENVPRQRRFESDRFPGVVQWPTLAWGVTVSSK
jgi:UDP-N-acetylmuramoyl-tripeptide--D-alanyl-D-alanine ligase